MITTEHTFGGASISIKIVPISEMTPMNPKLAPDVESFLSMMQKASFCGQDENFSKLLGAFLEEMDMYLDDGRMARADEELPMDEATVAEMEEFMNEHLPAEVLKSLKKIGGDE